MAMLLLLGGTGEAVKLALGLHQQGVPVVYSIAGLVRHPDLPVPVIAGGFSQYGGLVGYIRQHRIAGILDATHPYAANISAAAVHAARQTQIPIWRYLRPPWQAEVGDNWQVCRDWSDVVTGLASAKHILLTTGQLTETQRSLLAASRCHDQQFLLRTAVRPAVTLPDWMQSIQHLGPFTIEAELDFLRQQRIDALVTKNSGGEATVAKLHAARELGIAVMMLERPILPAVDVQWERLELCIDALRLWHQNSPLSSG